jgi:peroxiredoxin
MAIRTSARPALALVAGLALGLTAAAHADDHGHAGHDHAGHDHAKSDHAAAQSMATAEVGAPAPDFTLTSVDGKAVSLSEFTAEGKTVVLEWFNPDCPFVKKHHAKHDTMKATHAKYPDVTWLAINSGAPGKQGNGKERNAEAVKDYGITYPLLLDEDGTVGRLYGAKTTPHMFVIHEGNLVYAGAIDDNRSPDKLGETNYVVAALDAIQAGKDVAEPETKSYGCSVKYSANPVP